MLWFHKGYCVVKKLVWNVRIKAFGIKITFVKDSSQVLQITIHLQGKIISIFFLSILKRLVKKKYRTSVFWIVKGVIIFQSASPEAVLAGKKISSKFYFLSSIWICKLLASRITGNSYYYYTLNKNAFHWLCIKEANFLKRPKHTFDLIWPLRFLRVFWELYVISKKSRGHKKIKF